MRSKLVAPFLMLMLVVGQYLLPTFASTADAALTTASNLKNARKALGDKIKHIIVLMEENRSYDHLMGWYPRGDGLNGSEYNLRNVSDPDSKKEYVNADAPYVNICDPNHGVPATTYKLFGPDFMNVNRTSVSPSMDGFAMWELDHANFNKEFCGVLDMFNTTEKLPVLSKLADEYTFFDRFFSSVPGPTWPNREFFMSGTSAGLTETFPWFQNVKGRLYPQKTIFDQVAEAGAEWKLYYQDGAWELFMESLAHNPEHLHSLDQFYEDCATGDLPSFAFINPRGAFNITTGEGSNDGHPDHDMALAEGHYKNVYEALRSSPAWNETLFVLTFDEHGGFYDHVSPPSRVPPPGDGYPSFPDNWFRFDRLGIRVPMLLISPWIKKGQIISDPPAAQKPEGNSAYDLTSIMASSRKILTVLNQTGPLTHRDAWVATWEHALEELQEPRTDCPMHLPQPPAPSIPPNHEAALPLNELQTHMLTVHGGLLVSEDHEEEFPLHIRKQGQVGEWLQTKFQQHKAQTSEWKATKVRPEYHVVVEVYPTAANQSLGLEDFRFSLRNNGSRMTLSQPNNKSGLCLDAGRGFKSGNNLTVTNCYPTANPIMNRDREQQWTYHADATLRPYHNTSVCAATRFFDSNETDKGLFLEDCVKGKLQQHFTYFGKTGPFAKWWGYGVGTLQFMLQRTDYVQKTL